MSPPGNMHTVTEEKMRQREQEESFSFNQKSSQTYLQGENYEWENTSEGDYVLSSESSVAIGSSQNLGEFSNSLNLAMASSSALAAFSTSPTHPYVNSLQYAESKVGNSIQFGQQWRKEAIPAPVPKSREDGWNFCSDPSSWRIRHPRSKTQHISLVLCLNIGTDPPNVIRTEPCARMEAWVDPKRVATGVREDKKKRTSDMIAQRLQHQFKSWQAHAQFQLNIDPTLTEMERNCATIRRSAQNMRVLMHYNGHGVPSPTPNGEIWVFSEDFRQYMPLTVNDLVNWLGYPCMFTMDCSNAGLLMNYLVKGHEDDNSCIVMLACGARETLPIHPDYPADVFTSCLTSPLKIAIRWFVLHNLSSLSRLGIDAKMATATHDLWDYIPGRADQRKTPKGELNWIFTSITDSIAWQVLPPLMFRQLFRQDLLVASMFRNFILADRIMRSFGCTPMSHPPLPATWSHPLWDAFDMAIVNCLTQLHTISSEVFEVGAYAPRRQPVAAARKIALAPSRQQPPSKPGAKLLRNQRQPADQRGYRQQPVVDQRMAKIQQLYVPSTFYANQLLSFDMWLNLTEPTNVMPGELPIILQLLLSQPHRVVALKLLARFLDRGPIAVALSLLVGVHPYVLKLLPNITTDQQAVLIHIWSKILAFDKSCQEDLVRPASDTQHGGASHFIKLLREVPTCPNPPTRHSLASQGVGDYHEVDDDEELRKYNADIDRLFNKDCEEYLSELHERIRVAYILSVIVSGFTEGKRVCLKHEMIQACFPYLKVVLPDHASKHSVYPPEVAKTQALLRQWVALALGTLWDQDGFVRRYAVGVGAKDKLVALLNDPHAAVRTAAVFALGKLIGTHMDPPGLTRQPPGRDQLHLQNRQHPRNQQRNTQMDEHVNRRQQSVHQTANSMAHPNRYPPVNSARSTLQGGAQADSRNLSNRPLVHFDDKVADMGASRNGSIQTPPHVARERPKQFADPGTPNPEALFQQQKYEAVESDCSIALKLLQVVQMDGSVMTRRELVFAVARFIFDPRHAELIQNCVLSVIAATEKWFVKNGSYHRQHPRLFSLEDLKPYLDVERNLKKFGPIFESYITIWCTLKFISENDSFPAVQTASRKLVSYVEKDVEEKKVSLLQKKENDKINPRVFFKAKKAMFRAPGHDPRLSANQQHKEQTGHGTLRPLTDEQPGRHDPDFDGVGLASRRVSSANDTNRNSSHGIRHSAYDGLNREDVRSGDVPKNTKDLELSSEEIITERLSKYGLSTSLYERCANCFAVPGMFTFRHDIDRLAEASRRGQSGDSRDPLEEEEMVFAKRRRRDAFLLQVKKALRDEGWHWARMEKRQQTVPKEARSKLLRISSRVPSAPEERKPSSSGQLVMRRRRRSTSQTVIAMENQEDEHSPLFKQMIEHRDVPCLLGQSMVTDHDNEDDSGDDSDYGFSTLSDDQEEGEPAARPADAAPRTTPSSAQEGTEGGAEHSARTAKKHPWQSPIADDTIDEEAFLVENPTMGNALHQGKHTSQRRSTSVSSAMSVKEVTQQPKPFVDARIKRELERLIRVSVREPQRYGSKSNQTKKSSVSGEKYHLDNMDWGETLDFAEALIYIGLRQSEIKQLKEATHTKEAKNESAKAEAATSQQQNGSSTSNQAVGTSTTTSSQAHLQRVFPVAFLTSGAGAARSPCGMVFHPHEPVLVSGNQSGWLTVWDLDTRKPLRCFQNKLDVPVSLEPGASPPAQSVHSSPHPLAPFASPPHPVAQSAPSARGALITHLSWINQSSDPLLLTAADDGHFRVWRNLSSADTVGAAEGQRPADFAGHVSPTRLPMGPAGHHGAQRLATSFDGFSSERGCRGMAFPGLVAKWQQGPGHLLYGGHGSALRVWDMQAETALEDLILLGSGKDSSVSAIACQEGTAAHGLGGSVVVLGCENGAVQLYDKRAHRGTGVEPNKKQKSSLQFLGEPQASGSKVLGLHIPNSTTGFQVVAAHASGMASLWDVRLTQNRTGAKSLNNVKSMAVTCHSQSMRTVAFHPYAPVFVTGSVKPKASIKLFNTQGTLLTTCAYQEGFIKTRIPPVSVLAFHPFKLLFAAGSSTSSDSIITIYSSVKNYS